jgi:opacity protein-like surface antigen
MKTFLWKAALSAMVLSAGAAQAQTPTTPDSNLSVSLLGGWSSHPGLMLGGTKRSVNDAYNLGGRVSYDLSDTPLQGFSVDADYFFNRADYAGSPKANLNSSSFMGDLIYHVPTASPWSFYGGAGLGLVHDNLNGSLHGSSDVLGWQALGGAEYAFSPSTSLFTEYRYQNAHDANVGGVKGVGNTSNNLSMGVRFKF